MIGTGFAAYSTVTITLYSSPLILATVTTDEAGGFRAAVTVPAELPAGQHTFIAAGVDPTGAAHTMKLAITVAASVVPASASGEGDGDGDTLPSRVRRSPPWSWPASSWS